MADGNNDGESKNESKSSSGMLVVAAIVGLLAGGGGVAAAFFGMQSFAVPTAAEEAPKKINRKKALFHELDPFVISLVGERRSRYLQLELAVMTREETMLDVLTENNPLIRNELIGFAGGMTYQDALQPETPERLRSESLKRLRAILSDQGGELIENIMIVNFVIQ